MRTIVLATVAALTIPLSPVVADDDDDKDGLGAHEATHTVQQRTFDEKKVYPGVRQQQGRVLTDSDRNGTARKMPGLHKYGNITLKRGIISRDKAIAHRRMLDPLKKRVDTRSMRTTEVEYAEKLRLWAVRQDARLLELQKIHSAYDRLKTYRDNAAANGDNVSRIDPRIAGMERKMAALTEEIELAVLELQKLTSRYQQQLNIMSRVSRDRHKTAVSIIGNMQA